MIFGDNQTKHFYVIPASNGYTVKDLENSDLVTLILNQDDNKKVTTDVINRKLIKHAKINQVKPTYLRKWTVTAPSTITDGNTYHVYFYLENMMGFGMQDRWDRVASYTAKDDDDATIVMTKLAKDLNLKLNAAGPIKNDFFVTILNGTMNPTDATVLFGVTPTTSRASWDDTTDTESLTKESGTTSNTLKYTLVKHEGDYKVTYIYDNVIGDYTVNNNVIIVAENPNSETFAQLNELDLRMHTNPYAYNVTMSTGEANGNDITPWGGQKQIIATDTTNVYISAATKVMAMELYFLRNRADKYDLTKDFYASILNKPQTVTTNSDYYTLDIDYAFSDTQGYTYHSDKQLSIACSALTTLENLRQAILKDSNETSLGYTDTATYTQATDDED